MLQNCNISPMVGEIWYAVIPNAIGSQQGGKRPVLVISNNIFNKSSTMAGVCPLTKQNKKSPVHIFLSKDDVDGLKYDSFVLVEQTCPINKFQFIEKIGNFPKVKERELAEKFSIQFPWLNIIKN